MRWSAVTTVAAADLDDLREAAARRAADPAFVPTHRRGARRRRAARPGRRRARAAPARRPVAGGGQPGGPGGRAQRQGPARGATCSSGRAACCGTAGRASPSGCSAASTGADLEGGWQLPRDPRGRRRRRLRAGRGRAARRRAPDAAYRLALTLAATPASLTPVSNDADPPSRTVRRDPDDEPVAEPAPTAEHPPAPAGRCAGTRDEDDESIAAAARPPVGAGPRRAPPRARSRSPAGRSNFSRAQVPWGLDLAAAWAWRLLVIAAAGYVIFWLLGFFAVIALPLVDRAADHRAGHPVGRRDARGSGCRAGWPRSSWSSAGSPRSALLLTFAGQQVAERRAPTSPTRPSRASARSRTGSRTAR